jgi:hypothetical protein
MQFAVFSPFAFPSFQVAFFAFLFHCLDPP